jgi:predicted DNA-binding transcriptional regulator AlpA
MTIPTPPAAPEVLTLEEAGALVRMHPQTLRRSTCPRSKIGGRLRFLRSVVLQWVASHQSHALADVA